MSREQKPSTHPFSTIGSFICRDGQDVLIHSGRTVAWLPVSCVSNVVRYVDGSTNDATVWGLAGCDDVKRLTIVEKQRDNDDVGVGVAARERPASGSELTVVKHSRAMRRSEGA